MDTLRLPANKPLMIAHRGLSWLELENTCSAFVAAGNRTHYGIETDVHVTSDGQYIIIHDDNTKRISGDHLVVEETTFETLRSLRLLDKDGKRGRNDLRLPSLQEYIQICKRYEKKSVLELKNFMEPQHIANIIEIIRQEGWLENTIFISFVKENVLCVREMLPEQKVQYLCVHYTPELLAFLKENRLDMDIFACNITAENVQELHENGIEVNVWTVNNMEEGQRMIDIGVDYITSDILE